MLGDRVSVIRESRILGTRQSLSHRSLKGLKIQGTKNQPLCPPILPTGYYDRLIFERTGREFGCDEPLIIKEAG